MPFFTILLVPYLSASQTRLIGIIENSDGYSYIRAGRGIQHEAIGKVLDNELFFYYEDLDPDEDWLEVSVTKFKNNTPSWTPSQVNGFIRRSSIINVEALAPQRKRTMIEFIFNKEKSLYDQVINASNRTSAEFQMLRDETVIHHDFQFIPVLKIFVKHICSTKDRTLLDQYLKLLMAYRGSADELPSYTLAWILTCEAEWMFESMYKYPELFPKLEKGITNMTHRKYSNGPSDLEKKYNELKVVYGYSATDFTKYDD